MSHFHLHAVDATPHAEVPSYAVTILVDGEPASGDWVPLTTACRTGVEVDEAVDRLITQLNAIRHKAQEKLADRLRE